MRSRTPTIEQVSSGSFNSVENSGRALGFLKQNSLTLRRRNPNLPSYEEVVSEMERLLDEIEEDRKDKSDSDV